MKSNPRYSVLFIVLVVIIDTSGFGIIFPVLPQLLSDLLESDISTSAKYGGWLSFTYALMQFIFAPILGNLSDEYGRRPVLLSSLLGFSIDCIFLAFSQNILWLFIGRTIAGITGASFSVASACIADISTDSDRTKNFGLINAGFGLGFIIGPAIGGILAQFGTHAPFVFSACLSFSNFIIGYFFFPESLRVDSRRKFDWKRANPLGALKHLQKFPLVRNLILAMFLLSIANHSMESVWAFFTIERFQWNNALIGYSLAFIGALSVMVQLGFVELLVKTIGEKRMLLWGMLLTSFGFFLFAFTPWQWLLFVGIVTLIFGGVQNTAMQSIISSAIPNNEQGELQGALASLLGFTTFIAPPMMTYSFSYFTDSHGTWYFPGMPFFLAGLLSLLGVILCFCRFSKLEPEESPPSP